MKNIIEYLCEGEEKQWFDYKQKPSTPLSDEETTKLTNYFRDLTDNCEIIINNKYGSVGVYFPDRKTLLADGDFLASYANRNGGDNIAHLTVSKPARMKGGFVITVYKKGRWGGAEFPDPRRAFDEDGKPKYATIDDVIKLLDKNLKNGKWKDDLGVVLK